MPRGVLLAAFAALALGVPSAETAARPSRFLLSVSDGASVVLYESSDGVRFAPSPGAAPGTGEGSAPIRRDDTVALFDSPAPSAEGFVGQLRLFRAGAGGRLVETSPASYDVRLSSPEDAARATPVPLVPSVAVDDDGAYVLLYALRFEPETNACPVSGRACVKLRTATEVAGSGGTAFTGDPGNRIVLGFDPADSVGQPALLRADKGWAVLLRGPGGCLRVLTAASPHGAFRNAGCIVDPGPDSPSGLWDRRLREYRLYGVADGHVVRAVTARLRRLAPARFRPLAIPGAPSSVRVAANAP